MTIFAMTKRLLRFLWYKILIGRDAVGFARSLGVEIGDNVHFYGMDKNMFGGEPWLITIGNNVYIGAHCQFITHDGLAVILRKEVPDLQLSAPISIGNDVGIGISTLIMPGVKIGNRVIIGAGSVVTRDIPDNSVAAGVPARVIMTTDEYLEKAKKKSLHLGHLSSAEKEIALMRHFQVDPAKITRRV